MIKNKYHWNKKVFIENMFILISIVIFIKLVIDYIKILLTNI